MERMTLTIDRSRWLRGEGPENSRLVRSSDGKMCCLGFFGMACGSAENTMRDVHSPIHLDDRTWQGLQDRPGLMYELMEVNDDTETSETFREAFIAERFAEIGVDVVFVDGNEGSNEAC